MTTDLNILMGEFKHLQSQMNVLLERMTTLSGKILIEAQRTRNQAVFCDDYECQDL